VALAELLGVRTAFHPPGDIPPVAEAANLAIVVSTPALGYQKSHTYNDATHEVFFPGTPVARDGYLWPSPEPGFGVDLDEKAASRFPRSSSALTAGPLASSAPTALSSPHNRNISRRRYP
jgi:mannonate dehydratase